MPMSFQNDKKKIQYLKTDLQVKNETVSTRNDRPLLRRVCRYQRRGKATPVKDGGCSGSPVGSGFFKTKNTGRRKLQLPHFLVVRTFR